VNQLTGSMTTRNSHPPIHSSSRHPLDSIDSLHPSSLPPELGSLDMAWDDDPHSVEAIDLLQHSDLMDIDADASERTTAIPEIPMDQLVRATMAEADARESAVPAQPEYDPGTQPESPVQRTASPTPEVQPAPRSIGHSSDQREPASANSQALSSRSGYGAPLTSTLLRQSAFDTGLTGLTPTVTRHHKAESDSTPESSNLRPTLELALSEPAPSFESRLTAPPTARRADLAQLRHQMKDCYAAGNFSGALEVSEALLRVDPGDLEAQRFVTSCRDVLTQMLLSRIGPTEQYVRVALSPEELRWLNLDHRAGFFLSLVDGTLTIDELLDVSGMAKLESLRILAALIDQRVLRLEGH
jgi:hypothetical protein